MNKNIYKINNVYEKPGVYCGSEYLKHIYARVDKQLIVADQTVDTVFSFRNVSGIKDIREVHPTAVHFRFGYLFVEEKNRKIGVMTYLMLTSILEILEYFPDDEICFSLVNTSAGIRDKWSIYRSTLPRIQGDFQYRIFGLETREEDIEELNERIGVLEDKIWRKIYI